ncbi:MAG: penicillin-binding protein 2, partial [Actinobacteria bacterium]|nr:penicillin-binding protein 2 [Actinomycetota bacterium]
RSPDLPPGDEPRPPRRRKRRPPRPLLRMASFTVGILVLFGVLVARLWFLQVIGGGDYQERAEANRLRTVITEAPRGAITDRNGAPLVTSREVLNLVAEPRQLAGAERSGALRRLSVALGHPPGYFGARVTKAAETRPFEAVVLEEDTTPELQAYVEERRAQLPGISLQAAYVRDYPEGSLAAHVLGYTGPIPAEAADDYRNRGYLGNETVGRAGMESEYEQYLRGIAGREQVEVDARGEVVGRGILSQSPPRPGQTLRLSIDLKVQKALEAALRDEVRGSGTSTGAAGVAIDPKTGAVLALASYPTFDPDVFQSGTPREVRRVLTSPSRPLLDRAIGGEYPAASTFKAITATAALQSGLYAPGEIIESPGSVVLYKTRFKGFNETDHGKIGISEALEVSSDTFFYEVGDRSYRVRGWPLQEWSRKFGLGRPTGLDTSEGESSGLVPDLAYKRRTCDRKVDPINCSWRPGDSINMSIGQGNVLVTPIQMAVAYAAIANGGTVVTPTLGRAVVDADGRVLRDLLSARATRPLGISAQNLQLIRTGLRRAANGDGGTATPVFGALPEQFRVAGKTGTAENPSGVDHAWYVGYAPADDPSILVAVVVERGGQGANSAAPVVCRTIGASLGFGTDACGT